MDLGIEGIEDATPLGRGGFGTVYRARQTRLHRTVAVKVLPHTAGDETAELRFQREAAALGMLASHPAIVTVFDSGLTANGEPYLIMELVPRGSLADQLANEGPLPWARVLEVGVGLAGALASAHDAGVLHRDVKPANVLLSDFDEPMLADFGIARLAGAGQTASAAVTGSAAHLAPELLQGSPPSVASDIYALGSTLFQLLAGSPAFVRPTDETVAAAYQRILTAPVPDLRPQGVPDEVCAVLETMLAKDPAARPSSAVAVGEALRDLQRAAGLDPTPLLVREVDPEEVAAAAAGATSASLPAPDDATAATPARPRPPLPADAHDTGTDAEGRQPVAAPSTPVRRRPVLVAGASAMALLMAAVVFATVGTTEPEGTAGEDPADGTATQEQVGGEVDTIGTEGQPAADDGAETATLTATSSTLAGGVCDLMARPGATGGDGSPEAPFGTVADLLAVLEPGDVACLAGGTWDEDVELTASREGTVNDPVVIGGVSGQDVVLTGSWTISGDHVHVGALDWQADGSTPLTITGRGVLLSYLTLSNAGGSCIEATADGLDRDRPVVATGIVLRGCGTATAPAIAVGSNATFLVNNSVFDRATGEGVVAVAVDDGDLTSLVGLTVVGYASPLQLSAPAPDGATVSISSLLATEVASPFATIVGDGDAGVLSMNDVCVEPVAGLSAADVAVDPVPFEPLDVSVLVADAAVVFQDPADGDWSLGRGSGCDGFGVQQDILDIRRTLG